MTFEADDLETHIDAWISAVAIARRLNLASLAGDFLQADASYWAHEAAKLQDLKKLLDSGMYEFRGQNFVNLTSNAMEQIQAACKASTWMPKEYALNDVLSDICAFIRNGSAPAALAPAESPAPEVTIQKVRALQTETGLGPQTCRSALMRCRACERCAVKYLQGTHRQGCVHE